MDVLNRVLQKILKANPDLKKGLDEARVLEFWPKAVGPQIAKQARAIQLKGKTIMIAVDHAVWKQELLANKRMVIDKLNATLDQELGALKDQAMRVEDFFIVNPSKATKGYRKKQ